MHAAASPVSVRLLIPLVLAAAFLAAWAPARQARAFILSATGPDPWQDTASGSRPGNGAPATITWSIVPDGTSVFNDTHNQTAPSSLIAFMNQNFGGDPEQTDLTLQPWFPLVSAPFERWSELGGVNFVYEPADDGVLHPSSDGALGVRGDIRLAGRSVDGEGGTLAYTWLPTSGSDITIDTDDAANFTLAANDYVYFRNTLAHEIGHSFGLLHVSSSSNLLMEPTINTSFDGPQLDEVRGVQFFFGDPNEASHGGLGNGVAARATPLGTIPNGGAIVVGAAADVPGQAISPTAVDFVSIANNADVDFYSFSVTERSLLTATLTPRGGVFTQASVGATPTTFDANARNDLSLSIFADEGDLLLGTSDVALAGEVETLAGLKLPSAGTYYVRVAGVDDTIQLYELSLAAVAIAAGDFNEDGHVDGADFALWSTNFGLAGAATHMLGDADEDLDVDGADFLVWQRQLTSSPTISFSPVPEPGGVAWLSCTVAVIARRRRAPRLQ